MESETDLLICGAGPTGLMLALWATQYDIKVRIIDSKAERIQTGHADGLHSRTLEILDSFGLIDGFLSRSCRINEICAWNPDKAQSNKIERSQRVKSQASGLSRFPQLSQSQGILEQIICDYLQARGVHIERRTTLEKLEIDQNAAVEEGSYPVKVKLRCDTDEDNANHEIVHAKYVVGCDGGHSTVRQQLDVQLEGEKTRKHFGVVDIVPLTNFPDIRQSCAIHSDNGSIMTVPREDRLVRFYIQLAETESEDDFDGDAVTPEMMVKQARKVLEPYTLDFEVCDWHSIYTVGQRVAKSFSHLDRVFLAGDAVHTHSPTMGQGMNVSMQDSYNLGWKLGAVISGTAHHDILSTYDAERRPIALRLIELDKQMSDFYSQGPSGASEEYQSFRDGFSKFLSGVSVTYEPNALVTRLAADRERCHSGNPNGDIAARSVDGVAKNIALGQRLPSHKVVSQCESTVVHFASALPSTGKWRILVFAGDLSSKEQWKVVHSLAETLQSLQRKYSKDGSHRTSTIEVLLLHSGSRTSVEPLELHEVYHPWDEAQGWDLWKIFSDDAGDFEPCSSAYEKYGIDKKGGCLAILRPDQHVSFVGPLDHHSPVESFFAEFMISSLQSYRINQKVSKYMYLA